MSIRLLVVFWLFAATPAFAYMDPGSINYLIQVLVALIAASLFGIRRVSEKVRALLDGRRKIGPKAPGDTVPR